MEESSLIVSSTSSIADTTSSVLKAEALDTIKEKFNGANPWELTPVMMVKLVTNKHRAVAIITRARTALDHWLRTGWFLVYYIHKGPCREYNKVYDVCAMEYTYWCVCYRYTYVIEYTCVLNIHMCIVKCIICAHVELSSLCIWHCLQPAFAYSVYLQFVHR